MAVNEFALNFCLFSWFLTLNFCCFFFLIYKFIYDENAFRFWGSIMEKHSDGTRYIYKIDERKKKLLFAATKK